MRQLVLGLAMTALVMARPDLYREKEDFQYSRSSSDDGTKSGYYDAQRGNMGGNYERAHNMDNLAQHQMGGLVRQVEGELADGSKTRTGSVFSSANTRGIYGSGHYDLSNLQGRNFQEGANYDNSQLHSSMNSAYTRSSSNSAYDGRSSSNSMYDARSLTNNAHDARTVSQNNARYSSNGLAKNIQDAQATYGSHQYEQGTQSGSNSEYSTQTGFQRGNLYSQSQANLDANAQDLDSNINHRFISTIPVKIIVRPGQRIAVPIATQTYRGSQIGSYHDQNAINSETAIVDFNGQQENLKPTATNKHYESSYKYQREWEKQDTNPAVVPTINPVLKNSEAQENSQLNYGAQHSDISSQSAAFSQSRLESDFNARQQSSSLSNSNKNAFSQFGSNADVNSHSTNLVGTISSKPKSYQSSYSYHKSWERQGEPYVIKPASNVLYDGQTTGRLIDASNSQNAYSHNYGYNCIYECKPSHTRVARSHNTDNTQIEQQQSQNLEDLNQQTQKQWDNLGNLGQQTQTTWDNTGDSGQQTQNLEDFSQLSQSQLDNFENLGQQTQNTFDNIEDLGQQSQTAWDKTDAGQLTQNFKDFGQQPQSQLHNFETLSQQTQNTFDNIANLEQQSQTAWDKTDVGQNLEDFSQQQNQNIFDKLENIGQQTQNTFDKIEDLEQQSQTQWNVGFTGQQSQINPEDVKQQKDHGLRFQDMWDKLDKAETIPVEGTEQKTENKQIQTDTHNSSKHDLFGNNQIQNNDTQQTETGTTNSIWNKIDNSVFFYNQGQNFFQQRQLQQDDNQNSQKQDNNEVTQKPNIWDKIDNFNVANENKYYTQTTNQKETTNQQTQRIWNFINKRDESLYTNFQAQEYNHSTLQNTSDIFSQVVGNVWDKIDDSKGDYLTQKNKTHSLSTEHPYKQTPQEPSDQHSINDFYTHSQDKNVNFNKSEKTLNENAKDSQFIPISEHKHPEDAVQIKSTTETVYHMDVRPVDIGRGDIGPEDLIIDMPDTENTNQYLNHKSTIDISTDSYNLIRHNGSIDGLINPIQKQREHVSDNQGLLIHDSNKETNITVVEQNLVQGEEQISEHKTHNEFPNKNVTEYHVLYPEIIDEQISNEHKNISNLTQQETQSFNQENLQNWNILRERSNTEQLSNWKIEQKENQNINQENTQQVDGFDQKSNIEQISNWDIEQNENQKDNQQNTQQLDGFEQLSNRDIEQIENEKMFEQNMKNLNSFEQPSFIERLSNWNIEQKENKNLNQQNVNLNNFEQQSNIEQSNNWNVEQKENKNFDLQNVQDLFIFDPQSQIELNKTNQDLSQHSVDFEYQYVPVIRNHTLTYSQPISRNDNNKPDVGGINIEPVDENLEVVPKNVNNKSFNEMSFTEVKQHNMEASTSTLAPITEKPGFWKSLGNKFRNAKDKVSSWF